MSWLAPWFLFAAAGLAAPLIVHLIRRTPQGQQYFSTLMFLRANPPQVQRRSRLQHPLLLLLRLAAFTAIVAAFARPFWRSESPVVQLDSPGRHIAILVDTSASLRRQGMWDRQQQQLLNKLGEIEPQDRVALYAFDERRMTLVDFPSPTAQLAAGDNVASVRRAIEDLQPSWYATDLAGAVTEVAEQVSAQAEQGPAELWIASDFQEGAHWNELRHFAWPENLTCHAIPVEPPAQSEAVVRVLESAEDETKSSGAIRVTATGAERELNVTATWQGPDGPVGEPIALVVNQRQPTMIKADRPPVATRLEIRGDSDTFGNTFFVAPRLPRRVTVGYVTSSQGDDSHEPAYFFRRAVADLRGVQCDVQAIAPTELAQRLADAGSDSAAPSPAATPSTATPSTATPSAANDDANTAADTNTALPGQGPAVGQRALDLLVVAEPLDQLQLDAVLRAQQRGLDVLLLVQPSISGVGASSGRTGASATDLLNSTSNASPNSTGGWGPEQVRLWGYTWGTAPMLSEGTKPSDGGTTGAAGDLPPHLILETIDYRHPFFARFAEARFADFTRIRFWHRSPLLLPAAVTLLASFDDGTPFLWEERVGPARRWVMTAGWQPEQSQLGVSSKFVPLVAALLDEAVGAVRSLQSYEVGQPLKMVDLGWPEDATLSVKNPAGTEWSGKATEMPAELLSEPGNYVLQRESERVELAVNVAGSEGRLASVDLTEWLPTDDTPKSTGAASPPETARLLAVEVEARQRLWQWLLFGAVAVLLMETWLASRYDQQMASQLAVDGERE